jgi:uncharacterized membrane protein YccF (DUF307 family)
MKTLGNILWHFPFFGFVTSLFTAILGLIFMATFIGIPIGLGLLQHYKFLLTPFSSRMIPDSKAGNKRSPFMKGFGIVVFILYLPFGILTSLVTVIQIALLFCTIVGIPVALVLAKSLSTYFNPIGKVCVSSSVADELEKRAASVKADQILGSQS